MDIINIKLKQLERYKNNPRFNEQAVTGVANSIKEFGWKVPIVVDKNYVIVAGDTRYQAAQKLGLEEVPCIIADDLTEEQIKAFRLADNKVGEIAEWDFTKLEEELMSIQNIDMTEFEFEEELFDEIGKEFSDIPEEVELEKTSDDGEKININYLQFDGKKIALTDEELIKLNDKYEFYLEIHKTNFGFINYLLGSEKDEI